MFFIFGQQRTLHKKRLLFFTSAFILRVKMYDGGVLSNEGKQNEKRSSKEMMNKSIPGTYTQLIHTQRLFSHAYIHMKAMI